ncbi:MAG TPA: cbb3-type cytochrome c oxidase subunit II [Acidimicrobiia bacterium]|nr:cbb3-type cytochrome c oxidase subunit II [Acidimicrobiia bacterium]
MSDLTTAAAAMGLPEELVQRSAEARAAETGASVDDILAGWAGGEGAPATAPETTTSDAEPTPADAPPQEEADEDQAEPQATEVVIDTPAEPAEAPTPAPTAAPYKPPVLVGVKDNPITMLAGIVGLFVIIVMVALVGPSIPTDSPGARTSEIPWSPEALHGREVYVNTGCAACHTQMVRPVVADVGLGPVTLNDTNQVLGTRRFGPDLSDVGSRVTGAQLEAIIGGMGGHPAHDLSIDDLADLVAYLSESAPGGGS